MAFLFRPPVRVPGDRVPVEPNPRTEFDDGPRGMGPLLMRHVERANGRPVCVLIDGAVVREKQVPTVTEINAATYHYLGGHEHVVTQAERDLLVAAGYEVLEV